MKRWEKEEVETLRSRYGLVRCEAMEINGRSAQSIMWKARELGLKSNRSKLNRRAWTAHQDEVLRENYGKLSAKNLAVLVGRDERSIYSRASKLGITLPFSGREYKTIEVTEEIKRLYESGETVKSLSARLGCCEEIMMRRLRKSGIKIRTNKEKSQNGIRAALKSIRKAVASGAWGKKMSAVKQGIPIHEWAGFRRDYHARLMKSAQWKEWRIQVFRRDHFTCALCRDKCKKGHKPVLDPHHIIPKRDAPWLIFAVDNGITLCRKCHKSIAKHEYDFVGQFQEHVQQRTCHKVPLQLRLAELEI